MKNNISRNDLDKLIDYLKKDDPQLTHGPKVREFEQIWSSWLGVKYSVMVNSGASANDLTMLAIRETYGLGEIIVPPLTWVSDIASVINAGHKPVFVDINKKSLAIDTDKILGAVSSKTKAVFLTHVLGLNGLTDKLLTELNRLGIPLIEDVCESHGATHNNKKLGTFGLISNFSFYYAHHLTTIEGGMICTNDPDIYEMARMLRSHGLVRESSSDNFKNRIADSFPDLNKDFIFNFSSHNMRPTEINGVLGLSQIEHLDSSIEIRRSNFNKFLKNLDPTIFQVDFELQGNSNYAFILVLNQPNLILRNKVEFELRVNGIEFRRGLSGGGNQLRQPYLKKSGIYPRPESLPNVDHVHHFAWYIGNYPSLSENFYIDFNNAINAAIKPEL
jgi:CDP-4-dehydro-6-deoxyglucose reductase, E1